MCVNWDIGTDLPPVWGEEPGLLQIFLNLAQNSNKAMHSSEQKQLTMSAGAEGDAVVVRSRDTGPGVADPEGLFRAIPSQHGCQGAWSCPSQAVLAAGPRTSVRGRQNRRRRGVQNGVKIGETAAVLNGC
jgi:hypothetical protein